MNLNQAYRSGAAARAAAASSSGRPRWTNSYAADDVDEENYEQAEDDNADDDVFFGDEELENIEHDIVELEDCLATCDVSELSENEKETFAAEAQK